MFTLHSTFKPTGDQPEAINKLLKGLEQGFERQTLLGVTGSGKTFTMANIIAATKRPTLIISHNKTLAAQLYSEFKQFFPNAAVHYFVSYYDYYQPEAYIPQTDTYIEKEATINEEIDRLRHAATQSLINRHDVIIVASVSCIYGLGEKVDYLALSQNFFVGEEIKRSDILRRLVRIQYERDDSQIARGQFRVRGDRVDIHLATGEAIVRLNLNGDTIESILIFNITPSKTAAWIMDLDDSKGERLDKISILPAKHYMTTEPKLNEAVINIEKELEVRLKELRDDSKIAEADRLERKTTYDLEMIRQVGYCTGIENYSRHLSGRPAGTPGETLMDFFPSDYLLFIDESHVTLPQIRGMHAGDASRKNTLVEFGFRLPSARDNRPLTYEEFKTKVKQVIYVSATPTFYEINHSKQVVEQVIRPTGLLDPQIEVRPTTNQIKDLVKEIEIRVRKKQRVLVTTLTKRMAEELTDYLLNEGIKVSYIHSEVDTLQRVEILKQLRSGIYDVLVGVNLLREGLDLPEVSLVAILDADMSGFLRNETALIQTIGRAARHVEGRVIMYGDKITPAMKLAIDVTNRRRKIQAAYNKKHNIVPKTVGLKAYQELGSVE
jgi:excinuclease ABC subunit B